MDKPALGVKPAWLCAWQRIGELTDAIERQYQSDDGNAELAEKWAEEIVMQCKIIQKFK